MNLNFARKNVSKHIVYFAFWAKQKQRIKMKMVQKMSWSQNIFKTCLDDIHKKFERWLLNSIIFASAIGPLIS